MKPDVVYRKIETLMGKLLDPDDTPSVASLLSLLTGLTGIIISILPFLFHNIETSETLETSRWMIGLALGGKGLQHMTRGKRK